jgi:hypothetical protein
MTKAERLKFMRKRFGRPNGFFADQPKPKETPNAGYRFDTFGVPQHLIELRQKRIYLPDPKPTLHLAPKRMAQASTLTKIADKWRRSPTPRKCA